VLTCTCDRCAQFAPPAIIRPAEHRPWRAAMDVFLQWVAFFVFIVVVYNILLGP
jgi:hypothetical protein